MKVNIKITKKFGKYSVKIIGQTIVIEDDFFTNYGVIYDHVWTGKMTVLGNQDIPFGMNREIPRKDIFKWLMKKVLMINDYRLKRELEK